RREAPSWPTGSGGIGSAEPAKRASTGRAPGCEKRPAPRGAELADGVWGHRKRGAREAGEHWTGPQMREEAGAERRRAGRRGLGASEARSPRSGRALDGPPDARRGRRREAPSWPTGVGGIGSAEPAKRASTGRAPRCEKRPAPRGAELADGGWG